MKLLTKCRQTFDAHQQYVPSQYGDHKPSAFATDVFIGYSDIDVKVAFVTLHNVNIIFVIDIKKPKDNNCACFYLQNIR